MLKKITMSAAAAALMLGLGATGAMADDCSGRDHSTGTAVGAVGGGLIGGLATHSVLGGLGGALSAGLLARGWTVAALTRDPAAAAAERRHRSTRPLLPPLLPPRSPP